MYVSVLLSHCQSVLQLEGLPKWARSFWKCLPFKGSFSHYCCLFVGQTQSFYKTVTDAVWIKLGCNQNNVKFCSFNISSHFWNHSHCRCPDFKHRTPHISPGVLMESTSLQQHVLQGCAWATVSGFGTTLDRCCTNMMWRQAQSCGRCAGSCFLMECSLSRQSSTKQHTVNWAPLRPHPSRHTARLPWDICQPSPVPDWWGTQCQNLSFVYINQFFHTLHKHMFFCDIIADIISVVCLLARGRASSEHATWRKSYVQSGTEKPEKTRSQESGQTGELSANQRASRAVCLNKCNLYYTQDSKPEATSSPSVCQSQSELRAGDLESDKKIKNLKKVKTTDRQQLPSMV